MSARVAKSHRDLTASHKNLVTQFEEGTTKVGASLNSLTGGLAGLGLKAAGVSLGIGAIIEAGKKAVTVFATVDEQARALAVSTGRSEEAIAGFYERVEQVAGAAAVDADKLRDSFDELAHAIGPEKAIAALPRLAVAAKAMKAPVADVVSLTEQMNDNLDISVDKAPAVFDMIQKGTEGTRTTAAGATKGLADLSLQMRGLGEGGEKGLRSTLGMLVAIGKHAPSTEAAVASLQSLMNKVGTRKTDENLEKLGRVPMRATLDEAKRKHQDEFLVFLNEVDKALTKMATEAGTPIASKMQYQGINDEDVQTYLKTGGHPDPSKQAWCAMYVGASLAKAGIKGAGDTATSYEKWGQAVKAAEVKRGDVVVLTKGHPAGEKGGHVGLATGETRMQGGQLQVEMVAGNTRGKVQKYFVNADANTMVRRPKEPGSEAPAVAANEGGVAHDPSFSHEASYRDKNPFNVNLTEQGKSLGGTLDPITGQPQHGKFPTVEVGFKAGQEALLNRFKKGDDTIAKFYRPGHAWSTAPGSAEKIAARMGMGVSDPLNLNDPAVMDKYSRALIAAEGKTGDRLLAELGTPGPKAPARVAPAAPIDLAERMRQMSAKNRADGATNARPQHESQLEDFREKAAEVHVQVKYDYEDVRGIRDRGEAQGRRTFGRETKRARYASFSDVGVV